jgi:hypothetical protein
MPETWPPKVVPATRQIKWACSTVVVSLLVGVVVIVLNLAGPLAAGLTALGLLVGWPLFAILVSFGPGWRRQRKAMREAQQAGLPSENVSSLPDVEGVLGLSADRTELWYGTPRGIQARLPLVHIDAIRHILEPQLPEDELKWGLWISRHAHCPLQIQLDSPLEAERWYWRLVQARADLGSPLSAHEDERLDAVGTLPLIEDQFSELALHSWIPLGLAAIPNQNPDAEFWPAGWRLGAMSRAYGEALQTQIPGLTLEPSLTPETLMAESPLLLSKKR